MLSQPQLGAEHKTSRTQPSMTSQDIRQLQETHHQLLHLVHDLGAKVVLLAPTISTLSIDSVVADATLPTPINRGG